MTAPAAYLLDTNVVSEMMKQTPEPVVADFLDYALHKNGIGIATITIFEILNGIGRLPNGRRRRGLATNFKAVVGDYFTGRIFDFTEDAAESTAQICEKKRGLGEPLDDHLPDVMLAGIASVHRLTIVTRNESEFRNTGVEIVNPWTVKYLEGRK